MFWILMLTWHCIYGLEYKCPTFSQWSTRARALCPNPATYYCLENELINSFTENCSKADLDQPGKRIILRGGFGNGPCSSNLYQPRRIVYWTNVSNDCIYQKSLCTEEGQKEYEDGGVNYDRTCTCDHTKGYAFVTMPRNQCFCDKTKEDCSCYLKKCLNNSYKLTEDFQCVSLTNSTSSLCVSPKKPLITPVEKTKRIYIENGKIETTFNFTEKSKVKNVIVVIVVVLLSDVLFLSILLCPWTFANYEKLFFEEIVIEKPPDSMECLEWRSYTLTWKNFSGEIMLFKDNTDITRNKNFKRNGETYTLNIPVAFKDDEAVYTLRSKTNFILSKTRIVVKESAVPQPNETEEIRRIMKIDELEKEEIVFAVIGSSAVGKSTFINFIRNVTIGHPQFAEQGRGYTRQPKKYIHPKNSRLVFWELSEFARLKCEESYPLDKFNQETCDFFFILFEHIIAEEDLCIAKLILQAKIPFCFVRTKMDIDVDNATRDAKDLKKVLEIIRQKNEGKILSNKKLRKSKDLFLISSYNKNVGDVTELINFIEKKIPSKKFDSFLYCLSSSLSAEIIMKKYDNLWQRLGEVSLKCALFSVLSVADMNYKYKKFHTYVNEINRYKHAFGLDQETLDNLQKPEKDRLKSLDLLTGDYRSQQMFMEEFMVHAEISLIHVSFFPLDLETEVKKAQFTYEIVKTALKRVLNDLRDDTIQVNSQYFVNKIVEMTDF